MPGTSEFQSILNTLAEPVIVVNSARKIVLVNRAASILFGENLVDQDFVRVIRNPECLRCVDAALGDEQLAEGSFSMPVPVRTTYRVRAQRLKDSENFPDGAVVSFRDVSHVIEAEQMRSDFVANVSHELRSPLTALSGFIETLKGPAKNDAATRERFLDIMGREAKRMNRLIGDLLSLSKVEVNAHVRPMDEVDLSAVVERVIAQLQPLADSAEVAIELELPKLSAIIPGDEDQLVQVFQNLIENAVKYGGAGGRVQIAIEHFERATGFNRPCVGVAVQDFGEGIAAEHVVRLTERFYRVDEHRSREKGGTGLGLAIVKHIINRHRGRLNIASQEGEGSIFSVLLPQRAG